MNEATNTERNFTAYLDDQQAIADKLAKTNAIAARHGIAAAAIVWGEITTKVTTDAMGFARVEYFIDGVLSVPNVRSIDGGWTLVGVIDHDEAGNIVTQVPGETNLAIPEGFRSSSPDRCDHCNLRRSRGKTILVVSAAGEFRQIGATCAKPVLGLDFAACLFAFSAASDLLNDDDFRGPRGRTEFTVSEFVAVAAMACQLYGFVSKAAAEDRRSIATAQVVTDVLNGGKYAHENYPEVYEAMSTVAGREAANAVAAAAIEWASSLTGDAEFDRNLRTLAGRTFVGSRHTGLAAYIVEGYRRSVETARAAAVRAETPASTFLGAVGGKVAAAGCRIIYANRTPGYAYGSPEGIYLVFVAADGSKVTTNTTVATALGRMIEEASDDARFDLVGSVKEHKTYRDEATTVLTRVKAVQVAG